MKILILIAALLLPISVNAIAPHDDTYRVGFVTSVKPKTYYTTVASQPGPGVEVKELFALEVKTDGGKYLVVGRPPIKPGDFVKVKGTELCRLILNDSGDNFRDFTQSGCWTLMLGN